MNIMTKRGAIDNIVTYEHYCDTKADLLNIPKEYATLGSIAVVIKDENNELNAYIANTQRQWIPLLDSMGGGGGGSETAGVSYHICSNDEVNQDGTPDIEEPDDTTFYLTPADPQTTNNLFNEWIYTNGAWEQFGSGGNVNVEQVQSDWEVNDSSDAAYIQNRICYEYEDYVLNLPSDTYNFTVNSGWQTAALVTRDILDNNPNGPYRVIVDGETLFTGAASLQTSGSNGNVYRIRTDNKWAFTVRRYDEPAQEVIVLDLYDSLYESQEHTVEIYKWGTLAHKIDKKFLYTDWSDIDNKPLISAGEGSSSIIVGDIARNIASGAFSYAEGTQTTASGPVSHAEGGQTIASGVEAHAEGFRTTASQVYTHAEGYMTTASGQYSHSEGSNTTASGIYSHAQGYGTIANHASQHAFGQYNIEDPSSLPAQTNGTYLEIVGNGTPSVRSNARTLDWQGNEWLAGSLTLGNTTLTESDLQQLLSITSANGVSF